MAARGADALELAKQFQPAAVSLDVFLPDMLGWTVLSQLKQSPLTRHIPVQIVTLDEDRQNALARGAFAFVNKPATTEGVENGAVSRLIKDQRGVTAIEYGLIAALIAVAAVVVMGTVGTNLSGTFSQVAASL